MNHMHVGTGPNGATSMGTIDLEGSPELAAIRFKMSNIGLQFPSGPLTLVIPPEAVPRWFAYRDAIADYSGVDRDSR